MEITNQINDNYIIIIHTTRAKNNLEKMLQETFSELSNCLIDVAEIENLKHIYFKVVELYKSKKGKCTTQYRFSRASRSNWYIEIGDFMTLSFQKINGTIISNLSAMWR